MAFPNPKAVAAGKTESVCGLWPPIGEKTIGEYAIGWKVGALELPDKKNARKNEAIIRKYKKNKGDALP